MTDRSHAPPALVVDAVTAGYRPGLPIVHDVSLHVFAGEVVTIMGPNGAGKSTIVKAIARLLVIDAGSIAVDGVDLGATPVHALARHGVAYVPQTGNVFTRLSVAQNLALSAQRLARSRRAALDTTFARFAVLADKRRQPAGQLSGGQRQVLALAMAILTAPRVLLLDEPTAGLAPNSAAETLDLVRHLADDGTAVVLVEQNARAALRISQRGYVLGDGRNLLEAPAHDLLDDPAVADIYLGGRLGVRQSA